MKNFNRLPKIVAPLMVGILGITACSSTKAETSSSSSSTPSAAVTAEPSIKVTYYPNGTRSLEINQPDPNDPTATDFVTVDEQCDGDDLVEVTYSSSDNFYSSNNIAEVPATYSRIPDYQACTTTGRLTPGEFELDPSEVLAPAKQ